MSFGLTDTFASFMRHMNPSSWSIFDKFVVEPLDDILIFSMPKEIHIGRLALVLETFENHLCAIAKRVFWMLEVTFLVHVHLLKDVVVDLRKVFFVSS